MVVMHQQETWQMLSKWQTDPPSLIIIWSIMMVFIVIFQESTLLLIFTIIVNQDFMLKYYMTAQSGKSVLQILQAGIPSAFMTDVHALLLKTELKKVRLTALTPDRDQSIRTMAPIPAIPLKNISMTRCMVPKRQIMKMYGWSSDMQKLS